MMMLPQYAVESLRRSEAMPPLLVRQLKSTTVKPAGQICHSDQRVCSSFPDALVLLHASLRQYMMSTVSTLFVSNITSPALILESQHIQNLNTSALTRHVANLLALVAVWHIPRHTGIRLRGPSGIISVQYT
jgi:hypothetical protein